MNPSVIIYCRNNENTIGAAIDSIVQQTVQVRQIVLVDDASIDNSWNVINYILNISKSDDFVLYSKINDIKITAISNEFEIGLDGVIEIALSYLDPKDLDLIGILYGCDTYSPAKISKSIEYTNGILDNVGLIYSDCKTNLNGYTINKYRNSFYKDLPLYEIGNSFILNAKTLATLEIAHPINLNNLFCKLAEGFAIIHIPEILSTEV